VLPSALTLRNYRSFAGPQRLELRPITLLYGHNSAGKSALLRALPLLADSASADGLDALNLGGRLTDLELDFESLRWKGRAQTDEHTVGIDLHWNNDPVLEEARLAFWEEPEWRRLVVEQLALYAPSAPTPLVKIRRMQQRDARRSNTLRYKREGVGDEQSELELRFSGLIATLEESNGHPLPDLTVLAERLAMLSGQVLWLRSLRPAPTRTTRWSESIRWDLEPKGTDAPIVLAGEPEVLAEVSTWYEQHLGRELRVEELRRREVRAILRNRKKTGFDIDLVDTGEGLGQVLPVLTALAMVKRHETRDGPAILAIEEPEAHLHPDLQHALAQRVCEVVAQARPRVVLETHSVHFLHAIQLAVLRGALAEDDVIVYWVQQRDDGSSIAEPVTLTSLARMKGNWPLGAFETDLEPLAEIQDLRDQKESK